MQKFFWRAATLLGALGVAAGAFGAHLLKTTLEGTRQTATYQTAVQYHLFHALALLVLATRLMPPVSRSLRWGSLLLLAGSLLFCGSLYAVSLTGEKRFAHLAPVGGTLLLAGWGLLVTAKFSATQSE